MEEPDSGIVVAGKMASLLERGAASSSILDAVALRLWVALCASDAGLLVGRRAATGMRLWSAMGGQASA